MLKKTYLRNSQPWLRSVHYVNGPHDAVVLSLSATRLKLRATRLQGHKKEFYYALAFFRGHAVFSSCGFFFFLTVL